MATLCMRAANQDESVKIYVISLPSVMLPTRFQRVIYSRESFSSTSLLDFK